MLSISENFMDKKVIFKKIFVDGEIGTVRYKYRYQITIILSTISDDNLFEAVSFQA